MSDINWELLKFKYEVLGVSVETLAANYGVSEALMKYSAKDWDLIPLAQQKALKITDVSSLDAVAEDVLQQTADQAKIYSTFKQRFLNPKYIELESTLLHKAMQLAELLDVKDPRSANSLRTISNVLTELLAQNPLLAQTDDVGNDKKKVQKWEITVVDSDDSKTEDS